MEDPFISYVKESGIDLRALQAVVAERVRQNKKWGVSNHDPVTWSAILTEETGEYAKSALHSVFGGDKAKDLRKELIQTAATAIAALECLNRGEWSWWQDVRPKSDAKDYKNDLT